MKESTGEFRKNSSGQLLIVAALAIAVLISSTTIYVYELSKEAGNTDAQSISDYVLALKQATRNTMTGALANISSGGERTALTTNLDKLSEVIRSLNCLGTCYVDFTALNDSTYELGTWISWGTNDVGFSSAYANFTLNFYGFAETVTADYSINVTTTVSINGSYVPLEGETKNVNITCKIYNEDEPALAKSMTLFYENFGNWTQVDASSNLNILDLGNGTYLISFNVTTSSEQVKVSAHVYDLRNILVIANTTCYVA